MEHSTSFRSYQITNHRLNTRYRKRGFPSSQAAREQGPRVESARTGPSNDGREVVSGEATPISRRIQGSVSPRGERNHRAHSDCSTSAVSRSSSPPHTTQGRNAEFRATQMPNEQTLNRDHQYNSTWFEMCIQKQRNVPRSAWRNRKYKSPSPSLPSPSPIRSLLRLIRPSCEQYGAVTTNCEALTQKSPEVPSSLSTIFPSESNGSPPRASASVCA